MRLLKGILVLLVVLAVVVVGGGAAIRLSRSKAAAPVVVKQDLISLESSGGIYLFAARAGGKVILFDTGADPGAAPVDAALAALGAGRGDVSDVFLTHGHGDHTAGASQLPRARIHLGAGDVALAQRLAEPEAVAARIMRVVIPAPPVTASDPLAGPSSIDLGGSRAVRALPVPGHTPGSYAFLYDGVLFVGDIMIFKEGRLEPTPRLFNPRPEENAASIRSLTAQLRGADVDTVCTAHGGCTPRGLGRNLLEEISARI
jgi:glyoxylase-like metal-dependent hydrolase (beta-lactamase superfamily II)